jgi:predicted MFS family arabinose efflux permease
MFAAWPFIGGFAGHLTMVVCFEIVENAAGAGRNAYILDVMPEDERVATQAYMCSALNVGFTLGAIIGGIALAFDNLGARAGLRAPIRKDSGGRGMLEAYEVARLMCPPVRAC